MRRFRNQRGSAYLYVIVCVSVMGLLLVELIPYITQARTTQSRRMRRARADMATESLVQQIVAEAMVQPIVLNSTRTLTLNGATSTVTITDGSTVVDNSYLLTGTTTIDGEKYNISRYATQGIGASAYSFALYCASDMHWGGKVISGANGMDGDVFCNGNIDLRTDPTSVINGNVSAKGTVQLGNGATVTGTTIPSATDVSLPTYSAAAYLTNASYVMSGPVSSMSGATFSGLVNGHYPIYYINGDVSFQGPISGNGVVFVNGNITLTGNLSYTNSSSRVAVVATGNVTINAACSQSVGILFVGNTLTVNSPDFNVTKGIIVAKNIASGAILRVTRDNFLRTSSTEGTKLCLPGYWP